MTLSPAEPTTAPEARTPAGALGRNLGWLLLGGGLVALAAAVTLLVEKIRLLTDPTYQPSCSINPVLSCGSVMQTPQAEVFGFPNPVLGVVGFAVVATVGAALLAGAAFAPWFWRCLQAGLLFGVGFVHWLVFQSVYRIGALCPYCMVVWVATIAVVLYASLHIARLGVLGRGAHTLAVRIGPYAPVVLTGWYLVILALITVRFWTYWQTLLR